MLGLPRVRRIQDARGPLHHVGAIEDHTRDLDHGIEAGTGIREVVHIAGVIGVVTVAVEVIHSKEAGLLVANLVIVVVAADQDKMVVEKAQVSHQNDRMVLVIVS